MLLDRSQLCRLGPASVRKGREEDWNQKWEDLVLVALDRNK